MLNLEAIGLDTAQGERLEQGAYVKDFLQRKSAIDGQEMWKLERRQSFQEPGQANWEAFARGDWDEALRLNEGHRDAVHAATQEERRRGIEFRRVRVVETPIVPYVQWELNALRVREEAGEMIRVVGPEPIRELEGEGPLPELINVGDETLYEIRYDVQGVADGAVRHTDPRLVTRFKQLCRVLYERGEDLHDFFDREVAHLPPPPAQDWREE